MKIQYQHLDYQTDAVNSIVDLFDTGVNSIAKTRFSLASNNSFVIPNRLSINNTHLINNLIRVQKRNFKANNMPTIDDDNLRDFSIEMETGTGKTYVYLKTIFELHERYGLTKFIVIVPSIAIREGVIKTLKTTREHFNKQYNNFATFASYEGESKQKISTLKSFVNNYKISILVMSIQSFNKDSNIINDQRDDTSGVKMIECIAQVKPILILDEPQNMASELSKSAINTLNPLFKLRYSATHRNLYNLIYSLSPFESYNKGLVKKIEIASVIANDPNAFIFEVIKLNLTNKQPTVSIKVEVKQINDEYIFKVLNFRLGDNIAKRTKNDKYQGLFVEEISNSQNGIQITGGRWFKIGVDASQNKADIFRVQIRETIKHHLQRQTELGNDIKVLSLFFIDKVSHYTDDDGLIRVIFNEEFNILKTQSAQFKNSQVDKVHNGYFAKSKGGNSENDKKVYNLIMKDKEKLLSFEEPTCFIFSHSALKEGWDNPNVFNICTLNETKSSMRKRQEIGRGMRLCLDKTGKRIYDRNINKLIVIPNESYQDYVATLQSEFKNDNQTAIIPSDSNKKITVKFKKYFATNDENFKKLWEKIKQKTQYNIKITSDDLITKIVDKINENLSVSNIMIKVERHQLLMDNNTVSTIYSSDSVGEIIDKNYPINNLVAKIAKQTQLTKHTILQILEQIDNLDCIFSNPQEFIRSLIVIFKNTLNDELINGIKYFEINDYWEMSLFDDIKTYKNKIVPSKKSIYEHTIFDSDGEREFAKNLDSSDMVKVFAKLPSWFKVDTPIGEYNPDWAIVWQDNKEEKLYLVRETKFLDDLSNLRDSERHKIVCAKKHFKTIKTDFKVSQKQDLSDLIQNL